MPFTGLLPLWRSCWAQWFFFGEARSKAIWRDRVLPWLCLVSPLWLDSLRYYRSRSTSGRVLIPPANILSLRPDDCSTQPPFLFSWFTRARWIGHFDASRTRMFSSSLSQALSSLF